MERVVAEETPVFELADVHVAFGGRVVFEGASLAVHHGELVLVAGPSGSGKTTLLDLLAGVRSPARGEARFHGQRVAGLDDLAGKVAYLIAEPERYFFEPTVLDEVALTPRAALGLAREAARERAREALRAVGLDETYEGRDPLRLSRGEMRRVALAAVIVAGAGAYLLDEPLIGLDYRATIDVVSAIASLVDAGRTVVVCTHELDPFFPIASRLAVIADRRIEDVPAAEPAAIARALASAGFPPTERVELAMLAAERGHVVDLRAGEPALVEALARLLEAGAGGR